MGVSQRSDDLHRTAAVRANRNVDTENTSEKDSPGESMAALAVGRFIVLFGRSERNLISI